MKKEKTEKTELFGRFSYEPRWVSATEVAVEEKTLKDIKFQIEFLMLMQATGRLEKADKACEKADTVVCIALGAGIQEVVGVLQDQPLP